MSYTAKTNWKDGDTLPASDLNRIEQGVADANEPVSYADLTNKPALLAIGTTATTAKAGNWKPAIADLPTGTTATTVALGNHTHVGLVTAVTAPTITITDPPDDENIQAAFDSLIATLKTAGVLK